MSQGTSSGLSSGRVEAFSDGIFAIAATLLVLSIQLPAQRSGGLGASLLRLWPEYATYAASFLVIGINGINHHALFARVARVDRPLVVWNLALLIVVAFIPFPTAVLGSSIGVAGDASVAAVFYSVTSVLSALAWSGVFVYIARHPGLLHPGYEAADFAKATPWFLLGLGSYLACVPLSFVSPPLVVLLTAATAVYYLFDRLPARRPAS